MKKILIFLLIFIYSNSMATDPGGFMDGGKHDLIFNTLPVSWDEGIPLGMACLVH